MIAYVAGKYTGKDFDEVEANIQAARKVAIELWERGIACICPHLNTAHMEQDSKATYAIIAQLYRQNAWGR